MSNDTINLPLERIVESLIFAADEPLPARTIVRLIASVEEEAAAGLTEEAVSDVVDGLNVRYADTNRSFRIHEWAQGFCMATEPDLAPFLEAMFSEEREQALSRSLMETLAIVAYRQPVTKPEVDYVRGVDGGYALRKLMERSFVNVIGRSDSVGRPLLYGTTDFFLEQFGLKAIEDLPKPREIEELLEDPAFQNEKTKLLMAEGIEPISEDDEETEHVPISSNGSSSVDDGQ